MRFCLTFLNFNHVNAALFNREYKKKKNIKLRLQTPVVRDSKTSCNSVIWRFLTFSGWEVPSTYVVHRDIRGDRTIYCIVSKQRKCARKPQSLAHTRGKYYNPVLYYAHKIQPYTCTLYVHPGVHAGRPT